jgi:hypothetical protein
VPFPVPLLPEVIVIKLGLSLTAVQAHPVSAVTVTMPGPPVAGNDRAEGLMEYVQLPVKPFRVIESK